MKATDLMIDDWVEYGEYITTVRNLSDVIVLSGCIGRLEEVRPVPLTPEILEKNGFYKKKNFMQLGNFDNPPLIIWHLVDDNILGHPKAQLEIHYGAKHTHMSFMCNYVHELQHALKLCQIIKEIVL